MRPDKFRREQTRLRRPRWTNMASGEGGPGARPTTAKKRARRRKVDITTREMKHSTDHIDHEMPQQKGEQHRAAGRPAGRDKHSRHEKTRHNKKQWDNKEQRRRPGPPQQVPERTHKKERSHPQQNNKSRGAQKKTKNNDDKDNYSHMTQGREEAVRGLRQPAQREQPAPHIMTMQDFAILIDGEQPVAQGLGGAKTQHGRE